MSHTSKRQFLVASVVILALSTSPLIALHANEGAELPLPDAGGMQFSIKGSILAVSGEARELVYAGTGQADVPPDYKVSELIWDIKSLVMAGGTVSAQLSEELRVNAGAWMGLNEGSGGMEDYDWLDPTRSDWTHFSESDVDIEAAYSIDINATLELIELGPFMVSGVLGYKHDFWEWSDFGGTYIYSTFGFRDDRGSFEGENGIDYEQTFDIPYFGVQIATEGASVRASGYLLYSPFVVAEDRDHHILRDLYFREEFDGGDYIAAGGDITFDLSDAIFISGSVDVQVIPEFTGDAYVREGRDGTWGKVKDGGGIENTVAAVAVSAGIRL